MKVLRCRSPYTNAPVEPYHPVFNMVWTKGNGPRLVEPAIMTYCNIKRILQPGDDYTTYVKDIHKKKLCENCMKMVRLKKS